MPLQSPENQSRWIQAFAGMTMVLYSNPIIPRDDGKAKLRCGAR
jgi:hypothetical protein